MTGVEPGGRGVERGGRGGRGSRGSRGEGLQGKVDDGSSSGSLVCDGPQGAVNVIDL